jgi:hypothetical protein
MEVDDNMLIQNDVRYKYIVKENHPLGWWYNG